jgi:hypothetical protein
MRCLLTAGLVILGGACGAPASPASPSPSSAPVDIATHHEARAAVGKVVRVRGILRREKRGDWVGVKDLAVRCAPDPAPDAPDARDAWVDHTVTIEGLLTAVTDEAATISARGEIGQGLSSETASFVIRDCTARLSEPEPGGG